MEVWQYAPQNGVIESLQWVTDVIRCKRAEYRASLQTFPRQTLLLKHQMTEQEYALAQQKVRKVGGDPLYIPYWPALTSIPSITAGTVSVPVDASHVPAYKVGSSLLLWTSPDHCEVCAIEDIGTGTITISATVNAYNKPLVVPLRVGTFAQAFTAQRPPAHYNEAQTLFTVTSTEDMSDASAEAYPTYLGYPLIANPRETIRAVEDSTERVVEPFDSKIGPLVNYPLHSSPGTAMSLAITAQTAQEFINARALLVSLRGRWKAFWLPSGNTDLVLTKNILAGDHYIQVSAVDFAHTYGVGTDLAIFSVNGYISTLRVTSVTTEVAGSERLHYTGTLSIPASPYLIGAVSRICKLTLSRLDADRIELQYRPGSTSKIVVPTAEVPVYP